MATGSELPRRTSRFGRGYRGMSRISSSSSRSRSSSAWVPAMMRSVSSWTSARSSVSSSNTSSGWLLGHGTPQQVTGCRRWGGHGQLLRPHLVVVGKLLDAASHDAENHHAWTDEVTRRPASQRPQPTPSPWSTMSPVRPRAVLRTQSETSLTAFGMLPSLEDTTFLPSCDASRSGYLVALIAGRIAARRRCWRVRYQVQAPHRRECRQGLGRHRRQVGTSSSPTRVDRPLEQVSNRRISEVTQRVARVPATMSRTLPPRAMCPPGLVAQGQWNP